MGVGRNIYDLAFDPASPNRIAVAGWGVGVATSEDRGKTWELRNSVLPSANVWGVAFDPAQPGGIYASVHEDAIYVSTDNGRNWGKGGLAGSSVFRMKFVPEASRLGRRSEKNLGYRFAICRTPRHPAIHLLHRRRRMGNASPVARQPWRLR